VAEKERKVAATRDFSSLKWGHLPLSVFKNERLSALEIIVKFLKEDIGLTHKEVSEIIGRHIGAVAITYSNAKKKFSGKLDVSDGEQIPVSIFLNRKLSVLENLALYLSDKFTVNQISELLMKNPQTIYTVLRRARNKNGE